MTSRNNTLTSERGSALIVTMLLVSVLLMTALILLQRIVPYAKSVRSMHDASLAYYLARGEVDLARYNFLYGGGGGAASLFFPSPFGLLSQPYLTSNTTTTLSSSRINIFRGDDSTGTTDDDAVIFEREDPNSPLIPKILVPTDTNHIVISSNEEIPLQIKLFEADTDTKKFGTSKTNPDFHTLYARNSGGLRFDIRGVDTSDAGFTLGLVANNTISAYITLRMQYYDGSDVETFTAKGQMINGVLNLKTLLGNKQVIAVTGAVTGTSGVAFSTFLTDNNCLSATICSLSLILNPSTVSETNPIAIDFQIASNASIPDLNAVSIGDGISGNGLYYQRIIDLIPTPQDI